MLLVLCLVFAFFMILQSCCEVGFIVVCCFGFGFLLGWVLGFVVRFGLWFVGFVFWGRMFWLFVVVRLGGVCWV